MQNRRSVCRLTPRDSASVAEAKRRFGPALFQVQWASSSTACTPLRRGERWRYFHFHRRPPHVAKEDWAGVWLLMVTIVLSFAPVFPLCIAYSIVSYDAILAVGLVPLASRCDRSVINGRPTNRPRRSPSQEPDLLVLSLLSGVRLLLLRCPYCDLRDRRRGFWPLLPCCAYCDLRRLRTESFSLRD